MSFESLNKKARYSMIIGDIIVLAISILITSSLKIYIFKFDLPDILKSIINVIYYLINGIFAINIIYEPTIAFKRHKYKISENSIETITGIYAIKHTIIPIRRLQQIDINEGMINRPFGLVDINLVTAGETSKIEFIEKEKAELIVSMLTEKINEFAKIQLENTENYEPIIEGIEENGK